MSKIEKREITDELRESYLDYAMSVIVSRALPDVRDGLKPVQRRILWTMWDMGLTHAAKFIKSARVVGDCMGKYHPHGDMAIYDSLARMAQGFSLRYPLIQGQGNFGSTEDAPAAMRYCVTGDTLVVTDNGLMPIKKISENNSESIDIKVLSKDRVINKVSKWFNSGEHPTIKITTKQGYSIQGSHNHPIIVWTKDEITSKPKFQWKLLSQLAIQDTVVIDRTADILWPTANINLSKYWPADIKTRREIKILPKELNEDLAYILGALIAEGTIKENEIEFCNSDKKWINDFIERWQKVFPDCRLHYFAHKPNSFGKKPYETLEIHSRYVVEFLRNIGLEPVKSAKKNIPHLILQSPESVVSEFLKAYFEGDGSISYSGKMTELSAISTSESLINQLQILLLRFGISSAKRFDNYRKTHKLYIRGLKNYFAFKKQIGFLSCGKNQKLESAIKRLSKDYSQTDYVPFLRDFVHSQQFNFTNSCLRQDYVEAYNFDHYSNMQKRSNDIVSVLAPAAKMEISQLFEQLLLNNYLFDQISKIEDGDVQKVYSLRVDSLCHSFIANGFINHNTEARLSKISEEILFDIEKETVDWQPNYDSSRQEPKVLPAKLPNLLLNGSMGIAVGMATNIPPHNLSEVVDSLIYLAGHPKADTEELMQFIQGPDFPTGGIIYNKKSIVEAYVSGRGPITCRAKAEIEERKEGQFNIVVTEIPYQVNKAELITKIAELVQEKKIEGIRDLRDESDREGLRIVIELKNDVAPQKILNQLYKYTDLQKDFHLNMIALVDNGIQPQLLSLKEVLEAHIEHRRLVVERRAKFDLNKAKERSHVLEGLSKALSVIDQIISTIKKSKDREEAFQNLVKKFGFTDIQVNAILEMRLQTLAALERQKIEDELKEKRKLIDELQQLLKSPEKILNVVKDELSELKRVYGDERRTKVVAGGLKEFKEEDLVPQEEVVITLSQSGYIKRVAPTVIRVQRRGGKGILGSEVSEEDFITHFISADTHDNILFFTDRGRAFQTKVYEIPAGSRTSKGKVIQNFLEIPSDEKVSAIIAYATSDLPDRQAGKGQATSGYLVMATKYGVIKKTSLEDFSNVRRSGLIAINLQKGDELKWVRLSSGKDEIILATIKGQAIRFKESQLRSMGRNASGVRAIRLKKDDFVAGLDIIRINPKSEIRNPKLLIVTENGFAKQTLINQYKIQSRGGQGIKTAKIISKTGAIINAKIITNEEELLALSSKGQIIKTKISDIRTAGRATSGVRIMRLKEGDKVAGIVCL